MKPLWYLCFALGSVVPLSATSHAGDDWRFRFNGSASRDDRASLVRVDPRGNVFVVGGAWDRRSEAIWSLLYRRKRFVRGLP